MIQRDSSVKLSDLQYILNLKIDALLNTFRRIPLNHTKSFVETLQCVGYSPLLLLTIDISYYNSIIFLLFINSCTIIFVVCVHLTPMHYISKSEFTRQVTYTVLIQ